ncbi:MAG: nucleotidyltransferase domain-containing protein [Boseongicola sp. SB0677_bin_26]|nr:nucleotidyltransferase domain-containing protein [Boseongicola sp. SB0665_bin_10]MYG27614.1 nucleotidyltransferase domain-containing protein [Boseongicola sp. SB0677_bin_26]
MKRLRGYAASHGGRFIVFGSAARGEMRFNSDIDILADFPEEGRFDAIVFAEDACVKERLPCDVLPMPKTERMSEFMGRIRADMMELA